jgi:signal transduction histidine kinase
MKYNRSLEHQVRRDALAWAIAGVLFTLTFGGAIAAKFWLRDAELRLTMQADAAIASDRTEIMSGDIRSTELRLRKQFGIQGDEKLLFLDSSHAPWVGDLQLASIEACVNSTPCHSFVDRKIVLEKPIFFDSEEKHLWGFIHIERRLAVNWPMVLAIVLAVVSGALFQGLGIYFKVSRSVHKISETLARWAQGLSANPKNQSAYGLAPFTEIEPIGRALSGLKLEIDSLEQAARNQGALTTLRGIGHDILNPVARMKRLLGTLEMAGDTDPDVLAKLRANVKRLSSYAEQLKLIYKRQTGETAALIPSINVSKEVRSLAAELLTDPELIEKNLRLEVSAVDGSEVRIPAPALSRIVENLCSNSIQASLQGGVVNLSVSARDNLVSINVDDAGPGIPSEHQDKIFEPDFSTKMSKGTGLGLFVVKQISEQYGGKVSFSSRPGSTSFTLTFPLEVIAHDA